MCTVGKNYLPECFTTSNMVSLRAHFLWMCEMIQLRLHIVFYRNIFLIKEVIKNFNTSLQRLEEQSNKIFQLHFFSLFDFTWYTNQGVKIFSILVQNSPSYSNFLKIFPGYVLYAGNQSLKFVLKSPQGINPSWPRGIKSHFLKCLHRPLKGQCYKNKWGFLFY